MAGDDTQALGAARVELVAGLAAEVRRLTEAVLYSDVADAEIAAVRKQVAELADRLNAARRQEPPVARIEAHGMLRQLGGPANGRLNAVAPPIHIQVLPDKSARCEFSLSAVYEGAPGFVHGGVSAMVLDQVVNVAALAAGAPGMTASLELRYRRPTPVDAELVAEGRTVGIEGRKAYVEATITGPDGSVTIEARATLIATPATRG